jgi:hypothetical protein
VVRISDEESIALWRQLKLFRGRQAVNLRPSRARA